MSPRETLEAVKTVLIIDWPSKEVQEMLAAAGLTVVVRGGPGPEDYSTYAWKDGQIAIAHIGRAPECADLIYSYRPFSELPEIVATAKMLGAKTVWTESGLSAADVKDPRGCWLPEEELRLAHHLVHSAGLNPIYESYIADVVRETRANRNPAAADSPR